MNYMKQVAQMLGVELDEEFKISGSRHRYKFNETGLVGYVCGSWADQLCSFTKILNGEYEIIKLPKALLTDEEKEYLSRVIKPFIVDSIEATADSVLIKVAIYKSADDSMPMLCNTRFCGYYTMAIPKTERMPFNGLCENTIYTTKELDL